ncbi:MAG: hypothetical protein ACOCQV_01265 [Halolamina sp.]
MRPPRPPLRHVPVVAVLATITSTGVVAGQADRVTALSPTVQFVFFLVATLLVGGLTVALAPGFAERTADSIREEPLPAVLFGVAVLVAEFLVVFVAALFGPLLILVLIPLALLGAVTQAIGVIAVGSIVAEQFDEERVWVGLVVGAPLVALSAFVPILGDVLWYVVGVAGLGAVVRDQALS